MIPDPNPGFAVPSGNPRWNGVRVPQVRGMWLLLDPQSQSGVPRSLRKSPSCVGNAAVSPPFGPSRSAGLGSPLPSRIAVQGHTGVHSPPLRERKQRGGRRDRLAEPGGDFQKSSWAAKKFSKTFWRGHRIPREHFGGARDPLGGFQNHPGPRKSFREHFGGIPGIPGGAGILGILGGFRPGGGCCASGITPSDSAVRR